MVPNWFAWSGYAVGLFLLLSASLQQWLALIFPIWLLVLSGILLLRAHAVPSDLLMPTRVTATPLFEHDSPAAPDAT